MDDADDARLRASAFAYLDGLLDRSGGWVTRAELEAFRFEGQRVPLIARQRGIWKPAFLDRALSILTTYARTPADRPYDDLEQTADGYLRYKWRGTDANHWDNVALRRTMAAQTPLIWFFAVLPGVFRPDYPVYLVGEEPEQHQFVVSLDDELMLEQWQPGLADSGRFDPRVRYAERLVRQRLHQRVFRARVLIAYETQCAICRLRHAMLLDAAHIREDRDGGEPIVPNGVAMCAIHHRAFDANVMGIRPDYRVEIRSDVLAEHDGPTLQHALQAVHGTSIALPERRSARPRADLLEERFVRFLAAG